MYTPQLRDDQVKRLYRIKEDWLFNNKKLTMADLVRKAVDHFIDDIDGKEQQGRDHDKENRA